MSSHTDTHDHESHIHGGPAIYTKILIALVCLTFFTVFVARHPFENNSVNVIIALTVATIKASLVGLIFMHLKYDSKVNMVVIIAAFIFLGIMLGSILTDVLNRDEYLPASYGLGGTTGPVGGDSPDPTKQPAGAVPSEGAPRQDKIDPSANAAPPIGEVKSETKTPTAAEAVNPVGKKSAAPNDTISGKQ
jgi:cytochrome c oxidase subunit 4